MAENLKSEYIKGPSPGTPIGHETIGIETTALGASGGEEGNLLRADVGFRVHQVSSRGLCFIQQHLQNPANAKLAHLAPAR